MARRPGSRSREKRNSWFWAFPTSISVSRGAYSLRSARNEYVPGCIRNRSPILTAPRLCTSSWSGSGWTAILTDRAVKEEESRQGQHRECDYDCNLRRAPSGLFARGKGSPRFENHRLDGIGGDRRRDDFRRRNYGLDGALFHPKRHPLVCNLAVHANAFDSQNVPVSEPARFLRGGVRFETRGCPLARAECRASPRPAREKPVHHPNEAREAVCRCRLPHRFPAGSSVLDMRRSPLASRISRDITGLMA